eukprot:CAMPEP_0172515146 /NCGR_PEP_ID=MMETSP1066-20121228/265685_1 /TAXON_ID=671091 /ORGANISM="Coscinodiscus wailesii, Strain CCMP2513" /LENGTH=162 /DNA_ID=CAMNT_0013296113 /DNA_START=357 /DNA_END=845 /DNA_ORIENTATION=+
MNKNLCICVLPSPKSSPRSSFTNRLIHLENQRIRLHSLNAYVATLGGGYFLCRYLSQAIALARYQRSIALALHDRNLAGKCTVNEAYNYVHAGRCRDALAIVKLVRKEAKKRGDEELKRICSAAMTFALRVERCSLTGRGKGGVDDWHRFRVVEERNGIARN